MSREEPGKTAAPAPVYGPLPNPKFHRYDMEAQRWRARGTLPSGAWWCDQTKYICKDNPVEFKERAGYWYDSLQECIEGCKYPTYSAAGRPPQQRRLGISALLAQVDVSRYHVATDNLVNLLCTHLQTILPLRTVIVAWAGTQCLGLHTIQRALDDVLKISHPCPQRFLVIQNLCEGSILGHIFVVILHIHGNVVEPYLFEPTRFQPWRERVTGLLDQLKLPPRSEIEIQRTRCNVVGYQCIADWEYGCVLLSALFVAQCIWLLHFPVPRILKTLGTREFIVSKFQQANENDQEPVLLVLQEWMSRGCFLETISKFFGRKAVCEDFDKKNVQVWMQTHKSEVLDSVRKLLVMQSDEDLFCDAVLQTVLTTMTIPQCASVVGLLLAHPEVMRCEHTLSRSKRARDDGKMMRFPIGSLLR